MLNRCVAKFQAADPEGWEKIIMDSTNLIERTWLEDIAFERDAVMNICDLSGVLSHSQIFLAYS
jgi:hypothetical protein